MSNEIKRLVATPKETMTALGIERAKLYERINAGELESYLDGGSRKILWDSIHSYIQRKLAESKPIVIPQKGKIQRPKS